MRIISAFFLTISIILCSTLATAQKFYLGNYLEPTSNEFELIGISSRTGVHTYKYKKEIYDTFFDRKISDIIVGIRDGLIVTTLYNLIPRINDQGVPPDILKVLAEKFPYPFKEVNGVYGLNVDNESISIARVNNSMTFGKDRIIFMNSVKQSILESTKTQEIKELLEKNKNKAESSNQIPNDNTKYLFGDWISTKPIKFGEITLMGFSIPKPEGEFKLNVWYNEGIMYDHKEDGALVYPSSYAYLISNQVFKFQINFSAAGLDEGIILELKYRIINENYLELEYKDQKTIYSKE